MTPTNVFIIDNHIRWLVDVSKNIRENTKLKCVPLTSCKDIIKKVQRYRPAVIVLSTNMPDFLETLQSLRKSEETSDIPVIAVSELANEMDRANAYTYGCIDYLVKPKDFAELIDKLQDYGCLGLIDMRLKRIMKIYEDQEAEL